jgi:hypothetical protein
MMLEDGDGFGRLLVRIIKTGIERASSVSKEMIGIPAEITRGRAN